ncbi:hypothetical protein HRI_000446800 [Hibiscus trionum]|uniref:Uncharacterized protein n=1 Tax=Hibiscus trionum TaxID=183268 RepID=A0A9W7LLM5_HIBTR|nr:hypothetical protein HRI_000446800 [Hibiscus trionum]
MGQPTWVIDVNRKLESRVGGATDEAIHLQSAGRRGRPKQESLHASGGLLWSLPPRKRSPLAHGGSQETSTPFTQEIQQTFRSFC